MDNNIGYIAITKEMLNAGDKEIAVIEAKVNKLLDETLDRILNGTGLKEPVGLYPRSK